MMEFYRVKGVPTLLANVAHCLSETGGKPIWNSKKIPLVDFMAKNANWANEHHIWKMDWSPGHQADHSPISFFLSLFLVYLQHPQSDSPCQIFSSI